MNKKEATIISIIFFALAALGFSLTFATFSNQSLREIALDTLSEDAVITSELQRCRAEEVLALENTEDPILKKLSAYQDVCRSFVTNEMMYFTQMPSTEARAEELALEVAAQLQSFSLFGIEPIVIVEPIDGEELLSFKEFSEGRYTSAQVAYFATLKEQGITDAQMGTWVPFPEANVPYWNHDDALPQDFGTNVNIYLEALKNEFPAAKGSILLNSVTYSPEDTEWANGNYETFSPYIEKINPRYIDSVGVQGFPWIAPANAQGRRTRLFNANRFLGIDFAMQAGELLNERDLWVNTGTFGAKYTNDPAAFTEISVTERKAIFNEIVDEMVRAQDELFRVRVNIFAEDKSRTREATDWSYLETETGQALFQDMVARLEEEQIGISLYDIEKGE